MTNLTRYQHDDLELIINTETGEVFASIRATARMVSKSESTVRRWLKREGVADDKLLKAEIPTAGGIQGSSLITTEKLIQLFFDYKPDMIDVLLNVAREKNLDIKIPKLIKATKKKKPKKGYIYLFEASNFLKLGYSCNVENRLRALSRWENELEIVATIKGEIHLERSMHSVLHKTGDYLGDEWYPSYRKHEILQLMSTNGSIRLSGKCRIDGVQL